MSSRVRVYLKLEPGEVVCPVCDYPAVPVPDNPGLYYHPARYFGCRGDTTIPLGEVPGWPTLSIRSNPPVIRW